MGENLLIFIFESTTTKNYITAKNCYIGCDKLSQRYMTCGR